MGNRAAQETDGVGHARRKNDYKGALALCLLLGHSFAQNAAPRMPTSPASPEKTAPNSSHNGISQEDRRGPRTTYYGFDANKYPGDESLSRLHETFAYTGFWLNTPPGASTNQWSGKREAVEKAGFGFLVLFNGRLDAELRKAADAAKLGETDAGLAIEAARREGFPEGTVLFLDIEEGGRMLPEQKAYIYAWVDGVTAGRFRAGVYCSGIAASEGHGVTVVTANDLRETAAGRSITFWVANDGCPPSPGCRLTKKTLSPEESGVGFAEVWQFAQSPRRPEMTRECKTTYAADQNCYGPDEALEGRFAMDLDSATEEDPSHGRTRVKTFKSDP